MSDKPDKPRKVISASLASFSLQARLQYAEDRNKNLELSLSQLRSGIGFRAARLIGRPLAYLVRKFKSHQTSQIGDCKQAPDTQKCATDGAGGYLLSIDLGEESLESSLRIEFHDTAGNCSYYYQYTLHSQNFIAPSAAAIPVISETGAKKNLEVVLYIGNEIAYLRAFIALPRGNVVGCPALSLNRLYNSGDFGRPKKPATREHKGELRIACILDEFTWKCLSPEANLVQLRPEENWETFDWTGFDFLLVESAWQGESGVWSGALGGENTEVRQKLEALLESCRKSGVSSVFWNKEDPVHYEFFKSIAAQFDHIFTTDENVVEKYRSELSNTNVYCLPFFIQPELHNPIRDSEGSINKVCFAGTWYGSHHAERTKAMQALLDAAVPLGLDIYDRMYLEPESDYRFPMRYWQHIQGKLSYDELCDAHKYYACFINVNIVTDSPSMCARRVFEVLASSTPVVSNPSLSLKRFFKGGVLSASSQDEAIVHFSRLLSDRLYRAMQGHLGFRSAMGEHTAKERLRFLTEKLGKTQRLVRRQENSISIISIANCEEDIESILRTLRKFSIPEIKLLLGVTFTPDAQKIEYSSDIAAIVSVVEPGLKSYEILLDKVDSRFAIVVNPAVEYGANYVKDKLLCFAYMAGPLAYTHPRFFSYNNGILCQESTSEHEFTGDYDIDSLVIDLENDYWNTELQGRDAGWLDNAISRLSADKRIYAADSFNFLKSVEELISDKLRERPAGYSEEDVFI